MTDLVTFGEAMLRLSPPPGERLETARTFDTHVGGAEANVAVAAQRLGLDAAWVSRLPDGPIGQRIARTLRRHGVTASVDWADEGRVGTYYLERAGEPRGTEVHYDRDGSAVTEVSPDSLPLAPLQGADAFHVSGITPALSPSARTATEALLRTAGDAGATRVFDPNYREKLWSHGDAREAYESLLPNVDVLIIAQRDAMRVFDTSNQPVKILNALLTGFDLDTVVLTRGERGAMAIHGGEVHEQPAFETETTDAVGTGDAFVGGFLAARLDGESVPDALAVASAAAALKRTIEGDFLVADRSEVRDVVANGTTIEETG